MNIDFNSEILHDFFHTRHQMVDNDKVMIITYDFNLLQMKKVSTFGIAKREI